MIERGTSLRVFEEPDHSIERSAIHRAALQIIEQLEDAGFEAYLVGGGVRDLLLNGHPKDFDIATDATPEEIKSLFRRGARIIGRRFRIVHVRAGRDVVEVTTFRAQHLPGEGEAAVSTATGMLLRDNVYGDIHSDALRRDFTMNALYYSPHDCTILDFTTGMDDIRARRVKIIGDPYIRYQEDPVRMLRAVRLAAKLGFTIEADTGGPILELRDLLGHVPPARLFDECVKLFMTGHATATTIALREYGLFDILFPAPAEILAAGDEFAESLIRQAAANTDARINTGKRVTPAFIFAVILWPAVAEEQERLQAEGVPALPALHLAAQHVITQQIQRVSIPRRFTTTMREIWELQLRLPRRRGVQAYRLLSHPRFRAAYDFLLLREQAGENQDGLGQWWTDFQTADEPAREEMVRAISGKESGRKRRRRSGRKNPNPDVH